MVTASETVRRHGLIHRVAMAAVVIPAALLAACSHPAPPPPPPPTPAPAPAPPPPPPVPPARG
jgi:hypothetical protein